MIPLISMNNNLKLVKINISLSSDFKNGLQFYREFLIEAPELYRNNYNKPLYNETSHLDALKK